MSDRLILVVDDDEPVRSATVDLLTSFGFSCEAFIAAEVHLQSDAANQTSCLILNVRMPGLSALELQRVLADQGCPVRSSLSLSFPADGCAGRRLRAAQSATCRSPIERRNCWIAFVWRSKGLGRRDIDPCPASHRLTQKREVRDDERISRRFKESATLF